MVAEYIRPSDFRILKFIPISNLESLRIFRYRIFRMTFWRDQLNCCKKMCRGGGTGRRTGLKILGLARGVWVQFPPSVLILKELHSHMDSVRCRPMAHFAYFCSIQDSISFRICFENSPRLKRINFPIPHRATVTTAQFTSSQLKQNTHSSSISETPDPPRLFGNQLFRRPEARLLITLDVTHNERYPVV